ncbi:putative Ubiquitin-related domain-containing protein [Seiridium cardinale]|uniref:Ubiquitin-related domain-containing protein n=1 Tax=Seiridium cardinale TaxID=138064 RepID=A0ABR2XAI8_9PEZI
MAYLKGGTKALKAGGPAPEPHMLWCWQGAGKVLGRTRSCRILSRDKFYAIREVPDSVSSTLVSSSHHVRRTSPQERMRNTRIPPEEHDNMQSQANHAIAPCRAHGPGCRLHAYITAYAAHDATFWGRGERFCLNQNRIAAWVANLHLPPFYLGPHASTLAYTIFIVADSNTGPTATRGLSNNPHTMSGEHESGSPAGERSEAPAGAEHLNIKVTDNNNEVFFKIKRSTKLEKLMNAFCERQGKSLTSVRFLFEGQRVQPTDTPDTLEMADGDSLEVHQEQVGGRQA